MPISDRIEATLERWSTQWKDRLAGWLAGAAARGAEKVLDDIEPELVNQARSYLEKLRDTPDLPPETRALVESMLKPKSFAFVPVLLAILLPILMGLVTAVFKGLFEPARQAAEKATPFHIVGLEEALTLRLRGELSLDAFYDLASKHGYGKAASDQLLSLKNVRFPSDVVGPVWLHDKAKWEKYWDDVRQNGVTPDRIELLKEALVKYPSPAEAIRWMAREVFEPDMAAKYGLDDEFEKIDLDFMGKIGLTPEISKNHWRAHWEHASWSQVVQMLHRGFMTEQDVYDWFRLVEIPPYWRKGLTGTMWELPGRIEARMLAQYGLVDKKWLVDLLEKDGLAKEYRDVVADMMLVRGIRSDIQLRYQKGWLNAEGVRQEIAAAGLSEGIATRLYQWIVTNGAGDRTAAEKDISKTEIIKAYKQAQISHAEAVDMLVDIGYDELEADFILAGNAEVPTETPTEEQRVRIDTIRRSRRLRLITHDEELAALLALGVDSGLANAYTNNDDLRLVKA